MARLVLRVALAAALAVPAAGHAADIASADPVGSEFQVNTFTTGAQETPDVAVDPDGNAIVVWRTRTNFADPTAVRIVGRGRTRTGTFVGEDFEISTGPGDSPRIAALGSGFVVVWRGAPVDPTAEAAVLGRRLGPAGTLLDDPFEIASDEPPFQRIAPRSPRIAALPGDRFVVVFEPSGPRIEARLFDATGEPEGDAFRVDVEGPRDGARHPSVAANANGSFVVAWSHEPPCPAYCLSEAVLARGYDEDGQPISPPVELFGVGGELPEVADAGHGDFVVTWGRYVFSPQERAYGTVLRASDLTFDPPARIGSTPPDFIAPAPAVAPDGTTVVVGLTDPVPQNVDLRAVALDAAAPGGEHEFFLNAYTTGQQHWPRITATPSGAFLVVWESEGSFGGDDDGTSIQLGVIGAPGTIPTFHDGFESGGTGAWLVS